MDNIVPMIVLNDGLDISAIGFGAYALNGNNGAVAIQNAIDAGYRLIDTAYNN